MDRTNEELICDYVAVTKGSFWAQSRDVPCNINGVNVGKAA